MGINWLFYVILIFLSFLTLTCSTSIRKETKQILSSKIWREEKLWFFCDRNKFIMEIAGKQNNWGKVDGDISIYLFKTASRENVSDSTNLQAKYIVKIKVNRFPDWKCKAFSPLYCVKSRHFNLNGILSGARIRFLLLLTCFNRYDKSTFTLSFSSK